MRFRDIREKFDQIDSQLISLRDRAHPRTIGKGTRTVISVYGCSTLLVLGVFELWYRRWDGAILSFASAYLFLDRELT